MNEDLDAKFNSTKLGLGEHVDILDAYRMFAKDKGWYGKIADNVKGGLAAEAAVERAYEDMWNRLSASTDSYMRERLHDLRDVADRLQSYLSGDYNRMPESGAKDIVIVAQTMGPAELMDYDYSRIRGLILEDGTPTMHVAIVAKALNIPVLAKIKGILPKFRAGRRWRLTATKVLFMSIRRPRSRPTSASESPNGKNCRKNWRLSAVCRQRR